MSGGGIITGRPDPTRLHAQWTAACSTSPTYGHVGSTLRPGAALPGARLRLGTGAAAFDHARAALRAWVCHPGIGATVHPAAAPIEVGTTVLVALPLGPVTVVVPNRIVEVVDQSRRFGFAYGTLPGHQERGEESFVVEWQADDEVVGSIVVDARAATVVARAAGPAVSLLQRRAIDRYLAAWRAAVQDRSER